MPRRLLKGSELAGYIKERQAKQVRMLRQAHQIFPKLVIVMSQNASPVIETYVRMKQQYAEDILIDVEVIACALSDMPAAIARAGDDESVHAVIVQLPLDDPDATDEIVGQIASEKDVDGLGPEADYASATAEAIDWLLAGYGVDLAGKQIVLLGKGRLIGRPLEQMWQARGLSVVALGKEDDVRPAVAAADVIVSATGVPGLVTTDMIRPDAVLVDAGTASEDGKIVGDFAPELYDLADVTITPQKGGVGPLTVVVLFDHVIRAALARI
jgi:methylenetetrahydrofolate dehydrogenase (NADP+)/methenyltetrahydrofolate cyclohydrolase